MEVHLAMFWKREGEGIRCNLCARNCFILPGKRGFCMVRENRNNKLYSLNYGRVVGLNVDPIEKKPLFHFFPGSVALSYACRGCNWRCQFCIDGDVPIPLLVNGYFKLIKARDFDKIFEEKVSFTPEMYALTILGPRKIIGISRKRFKGKIYEIITEHGRRVRLTKDHRIMVWNGKKFVEKPVSKLKIGDKVRICTTLFRTKGIDRINLIKELAKLPPEITKNLYVSNVRHIFEKIKIEMGYSFKEISRRLGLLHKPKWFTLGIIPLSLFVQFLQTFQLEEVVFDGVKIGVRGSPYKLPAIFKLTPPFMRLLGYFVAEGNYTGNYNLALTNEDEEILKDMRNSITECLDTFITESRIQGKSTQLIFGGKLIYLLFRFVLRIPEGAKEKRLPDIVFNVDRRLLKEFLSAYLTGDGTICKKKNKKEVWVRFITLSEFLKSQLCYLLSMNGIRITIQHPEYMRTLPDGRRAKVSDWRINVYGQRNLSRLRELAVFIDNRQQIIDNFLKENLRSRDKTWELERIKEIKETEPSHPFVYDIMLEGSGEWQQHTFFAGDGILIHNCCNWLISHDGLPEIFGDKYEPEEIVRIAEENNCKIISHTYTEPTVYYEFAYEVARLAHKKGMLNTFVTNGYMNLNPLKKIAKYLDAATVDFKASDDPEFLIKYSSVPSNEPVFEFLKGLKKHKIHVEITNLIVPKIGENLKQFRKLVEWIIENLGAETPFHVLRFHPDYKLTDIPVTPVETLEKFIEEAKKLGLKYVYIGNVPGHEYENTYCPNCGEVLIERTGFWVNKVNLDKDRCRKCGEKIHIVV